MNEEPEQRAQAVHTLTAAGGERLDALLARRLSGLSRSQAAALIKAGYVTVNGSVEKAGIKPRAGASVVAVIPPTRESALIPEDIELRIVYEDGDIAVIDKPAGLVVHPAPGHETGTLVQALLHHMGALSVIGGEERPGIVHRLDKETSGLLVVAKNDAAHRSLSAQLQKKTVRRVYLALVDGNIKEDEGTVDAPIARHPIHRKRMAVAADGRQAVTHWRVLERFGQYTLVECRLETGRTHQIRVHMALIRHPVTGDGVYGGSQALGLCSQALHAYELGLVHPRTGEEMTFYSPLPEDFQNVLDKLRRKR